MKKKYMKPLTKLVEMESGEILAGSKTLVIDPDPATGPACAKDNKTFTVWDWDEDDLDEDEDY